MGWVPFLHPLLRYFRDIFVRRIRRYYGPICLPNNVYPVLTVRDAEPAICCELRIQDLFATDIVRL